MVKVEKLEPTKLMKKEQQKQMNYKKCKVKEPVRRSPSRREQTRVLRTEESKGPKIAHWIYQKVA